MINRSLTAVLVVTLAGAMPSAADVMVTDKFEKALPMNFGGSVTIENPYGDVEVIGTDESRVSWTAERVIRGVDREAIEEARQRVQLRMGGEERSWVLRTLMPPFAAGRWAASVKYTVRVPRTVDVIVGTRSGEYIKVSDVRGSVTATNINGTITFDRVSGNAFARSGNGNIVVNAAPLIANTNLHTINGSIQVFAPANASFQWEGKTMRGEVRTTFPIRLRALSPVFKGNVNAPGGPVLTTTTLMGNIFVLQKGTQLAAAKDIRSFAQNIPKPDPQNATLLAKTFRRPVVDGPLTFETPMGSIVVGEVRGWAKVTTGAGEVDLGSVFGNLTVRSSGGPLNLGEVAGSLNANTDAGDILVHAAREGGTITTGGGTIQLLYTGGPTKLTSGGGDIVVRQAAAPVAAETKSGDITMTIDPNIRSQKMSAKTMKGNVILNINPRFGGEIDATLLTDDPDRHRFRSDFPGLKIERDQVNGKTRFRITGAVNGGGEKIDLFAEDGGIQLSSITASAVTVIAPR